MRRTREITFRLAPPSQASSVEVVLSEDEHAAVERAAKGEPLGPFVRGIVTAACEPVGSAHEAARVRAGACGLSLGAWLRLVVLMAVGACPLAEDAVRGRAWLASR